MDDNDRQLELLPRRGGRRPGAGRPRSGVRNVPVATRLTVEEYSELLRRCEVTGELVTEFVGRVLRHELRHREGEATRARRRRERG